MKVVFDREKARDFWALLLEGYHDGCDVEDVKVTLPTEVSIIFKCWNCRRFSSCQFFKDGKPNQLAKDFASGGVVLLVTSGGTEAY